MFFTYEHLKFRYDPFPIGLARPLMDEGTYRTFVDNLPPLDLVVFREAIGTAADGVDQHLKTAAQHTQNAAAHRWQAGVSPHAPYTVPPEWLLKSKALADREGVPVLIHMAEFAHEKDLVRERVGEFPEGTDLVDDGQLFVIVG